MNTANDVLKLQTELSEASGSQKIAQWFIGIGLAILLGAGISAIAGKESLLHVVPTPLCMVALSIHMRTQARRRTHDLESQLQR